MSETASAQPSRRLAAIMFTDLVGYSALAHRDEALAIELLALHRRWIREILPRFQGTEIETVGDAFLIEFAGALAAVECALAIQERFASHNASAPENRRMELRIGIHAGDIEHQDGKVMGDGVNIASRIHQMAAPGGICVSEDVRHAVSNRAGFDFVSLGRPRLKHIATQFELFQLTPAEGPRPARVAALRTRTGLLRWLAAGAAAAGVAALAWTWQAARPRASGDSPSIAVLPFENLSAEPDSAYFTDGLHDAVIGRLAQLHGLKVISRTSVMGYREPKRNLRQIADELGVAHILEGTVLRAGNALRVSLQLVDARNDDHVWARTYDRELADIFLIHSDIAEQVAAATRVALTSEERARVASAPTSNLEAYDHYLRGLIDERDLTWDPTRLFTAQQRLEKAVALDPQFALAHAAIARNHIRLYWGGGDPSPERRERGRLAAETALRLQPELAEGRLALALYYYHGHRDYDRALEEIRKALELQPNSAPAHALTGYILRRQGRWPEALAALAKSCELDPRSAREQSEVAWTHAALRQYRQAAGRFDRAIALSAHPLEATLNRARVDFFRRGELGALRAALEAVPAGVDPDGNVTNARRHLAMLEGRYQDAIDLGLHAGGRGRWPTFYPGFDEAYRGYAYELAGNRDQARRYYELGRDIAQAVAQKEPDDSGKAHAVLAYAHAHLGDGAAAKRAAEAAARMMPVSRDAVDGLIVGQLIAIAHARLGEHDAALDQLASLLKLSGTPTLHAHELRIDPLWRSSWDHPRFKKLVAERLPQGSG